MTDGGAGARGRPIGGERARALAERSADVRRTLTLADMEDALGALDTPADARRWAKQAALWGAKGLIVNAQAFVGFMREWRENFSLDLDRAAFVRLERRIKELERELAAARQAAGRAAAP